MNSGTFNFTEKLAEQYRPRKIEEFVGLPAIKRTLRNFVKRPRLVPLLFLGPSGRGKTRMAEVLCEELRGEMHQVSSGQCDLDKIDGLSHMCQYVPMRPALFHFVLINEGDSITQAAQKAMLSKMDSSEPWPDTVIVVTANRTTEFEPRFLSRFSILKFDDDGMEKELPKFLETIARKEGLKGRRDFAKIAESTNYNVRDALMKLELELMGADYLTEKVVPITSQVHMHSCPTHGEWEHKGTQCDLSYKAPCRACEKKRRQR